MVQGLENLKRNRGRQDLDKNHITQFEVRIIKGGGVTSSLTCWELRGKRKEDNEKMGEQRRKEAKAERSSQLGAQRN